MELNRFKQLLESTMGNSKPLISEEEDDEVVVNALTISAEDDKCFDEISSEEALKVGLNHNGKYKVKKKGCRTKTKYKGPKQKYSGNNWH
jgi:hypothetical protein